MVLSFLKRTRTSPSRFGRDACNDSKLVMQLRQGRELRSRTQLRVMKYMAKVEGPPRRPTRKPRAKAPKRASASSVA